MAEPHGRSSGVGARSCSDFLWPSPPFSQSMSPFITMRKGKMQGKYFYGS